MIEELTSDAAFGAFSRSGTYTPPGGGAEAVDVQVVVDISVETYDNFGGFDGYTDTADFLLSEVDPERHGTLAEVDGYDGKSWRIGDRIKKDGAIETRALERV